MTTAYTKEDVLGFECRHATYCEPAYPGGADLHVIKEVVHLKNGDKVPNLRMLRNYEREFYITKEGCQNHKDKKEWEDLNRLVKYKARQCDLLKKAMNGLRMPWFKGDMRQLQASPYLYGTDISSTAMIKRMYQDKFPELQTRYRPAVFDIETDVLHGTNEIIMATLSYGGRVCTAVKKSFVEGQSDVIARLHEKFNKYLSAVSGYDKKKNVEVVNDYITKRNLKWELVIVESEIDIVKWIFDRAHEMMPDYVAIWNIDFEIPKLLAACERARVDPAEIFCDPRVPQEFRFFKYKKGPTMKKTASGKMSPRKPSDQWHTVFCPASFYFIDAMCAYRKVRTGSAEEQSYALDDILDKHLNVRKLSFVEADGYTGIDKHIFMQEKYPLEYVIYNVFDCVSVEELDESTNDLAMSMPLFSRCSDFKDFHSQPRRLVDDLHYFCLKRDRVIASTSSEMATDFDEETIDLDGWIVTLAANLVMDNGLCCIEENPWLRTNVRAHVGDLDVSASYPNGGAVFNISRETTRRELIDIAGVDEYTRRMQGINLSGGPTNSVEIACELFKVPSMETFLSAFQKSLVENAR